MYEPLQNLIKAEERSLNLLQCFDCTIKCNVFLIDTLIYCYIAESCCYIIKTIAF